MKEVMYKPRHFRLEKKSETEWVAESGEVSIWIRAIAVLTALIVLLLAGFMSE